MIIWKQECIVPHNEPKAKFCREVLTEENGWHITQEDTIQATYTKIEYLQISNEEGEE